MFISNPFRQISSAFWGARQEPSVAGGDMAILARRPLPTPINGCTEGSLEANNASDPNDHDLRAGGPFRDFEPTEPLGPVIVTSVGGIRKDFQSDFTSTIPTTSPSTAPIEGNTRARLFPPDDISTSIGTVVSPPDADSSSRITTSLEEPSGLPQATAEPISETQLPDGSFTGGPSRELDRPASTTQEDVDSSSSTQVGGEPSISTNNPEPSTSQAGVVAPTDIQSDDKSNTQATESPQFTTSIGRERGGGQIGIDISTNDILQQTATSDRERDSSQATQASTTSSIPLKTASEEPTGIDESASSIDDDEPTRTGGLLKAVITTTMADGAVTTMPSGLPSSTDNSEPLVSELPTSDTSSPDSGRGSNHHAGVIAGGVIGAAAGVALIAFLIWFWRKRRNEKYKYTIDTPALEPSSTSRSQKTWEFDSASVGPTPVSARLAEAVGYKVSNLGKMFRPLSKEIRSSRVNMNRGNSQFFETSAPDEIQDITSAAKRLPKKDRLGEWWSRVKEDAHFNLRMHNSETTGIDNVAGDMGVARGLVVGGPPGRRTSARSSHSFSGALGGPRSSPDDPFSDTYASRQGQTSQGDPFDDSYDAAAPVASYPQRTYDPRTGQRPRGSTTPNIMRQQNSSTPLSRGNVRSDQFDLEFDAHPGTRVHRDSYTSRVSSVSEWSQPRLDVGVVALEWADRQSPPGTRGVGEAM